MSQAFETEMNNSLCGTGQLDGNPGEHTARRGVSQQARGPFNGELRFSLADASLWSLESGMHVNLQLEVDGALQPGLHARQLHQQLPSGLVAQPLPGYVSSDYIIQGWRREKCSSGSCPHLVLKLFKGQLAGMLQKDKLRVNIPPALSAIWQLYPGISLHFQVDMDGVLKQQAPSTWTGMLSKLSSGGLRAVLPVEVSECIAGTFCRGWRRLHNQTLVLVMATTAGCLRLTSAECMVSVWCEQGDEHQG